MRRSLAMCLLLALILTGCTAAPKKETPKSGVVRVLVLGGSGLEPTLFTAFQSAYPNVKAESVQIAEEDDFATIIAKIQSGEIKVDAIVAPGNHFLFDTGVVQPMDDLIKQYKISLTEYGGSMELARYKGKTYGLPVSISPMVVVYNKDLFEKAGLKAPSDKWTWDDFEAAANALAKVQEGNEKGWGAAIPPWTMIDLLLSTGKGPAADDLSGLEAHLTRFSRMFAGQKVMPKEALANNDAEYFQAFGRGELGMLLNYWENSFAHNAPTFSWGLAPLPSTDKTPGLITLAMITTKAENRDNAEAFVRFAAGPTGSQAVVRIPGAPVPGYVDETVQKEWMAHASLKEDSLFVLKLKYQPAYEYPEALAPALLKEADAALKGTKTPADAIKAFQEARAPLMSNK